MAAGNNRNLLAKTVLTIISIVVAYFSVVSTMTISRVGSIEQKVNGQEKEISRNEKNIAVLLEKVIAIEQLVREIRQEMRKLLEDRRGAFQDSSQGRSRVDGGWRWEMIRSPKALIEANGWTPGTNGFREG